MADVQVNLWICLILLPVFVGLTIVTVALVSYISILLSLYKKILKGFMKLVESLTPTREMMGVNETYVFVYTGGLFPKSHYRRRRRRRRWFNTVLIPLLLIYPAHFLKSITYFIFHSRHSSSSSSHHGHNYNVQLLTFWTPLLVFLSWATTTTEQEMSLFFDPFQVMMLIASCIVFSYGKRGKDGVVLIAVWIIIVSHFILLYLCLSLSIPRLRLSRFSTPTLEG